MYMSLIYPSAEFTLHPEFSILLWSYRTSCSKLVFNSQISTLLGPAVSVMAMSLDSHVADHISSPGPGGLNSRRARVRARPRSREENGGEGIAEWATPWGVMSGFLSLSPSLSVSPSLMSTDAYGEKREIEK